MSSEQDVLALACHEHGITSPADFSKRFGIVPATITSHAALILVETPQWVTETWLPNAGTTRIVWVPEVVRAYAAVYGVCQRDDESDHDYVLRIQATVKQRMEEISCPTKTRKRPVHTSVTASGSNAPGVVQPTYNPSPCRSD